MPSATRVVSRYLKLATAWQEVRGASRELYLDKVWGMYSDSYRQIGLHIPSQSALLRYSLWYLFGGDDPTAFVLCKEEPHGVKLGLAGSDGSSSAKSALKSYVAQMMNHAPNFAEVSHAMEKILSGADVVCAAYVEDVIEKPIVPESDGVHYARQLAGVGRVVKKLVGHPKGVPTTSPHNPHCPLPEKESFHTASMYEKADKDAMADSHEAAEHAACQLEWD